MTKPFPGTRRKLVFVPDGEFPLTLRLQDCDAILAALEVALNERVNFGPGIPRRIVEEAGRRIEEAADRKRSPLDRQRSNAA